MLTALLFDRMPYRLLGNLSKKMKANYFINFHLNFDLVNICCSSDSKTNSEITNSKFSQNFSPTRLFLTRKTKRTSTVVKLVPIGLNNSRKVLELVEQNSKIEKKLSNYSTHHILWLKMKRQFSLHQIPS